ncbi:iron hydrogenase [Patellaria atrata CBS 101060]|uniref:Nuclear architecture-related protein 1 n=1 Tax=Patellaria atrata CBS 101060 TaxID=1346257 RepID=A0A9P4SH63_9PEZI|nr:iron hydrogenase [Patellaria atrata CBS 101060]
MSAILSADDLNDFISPGVACIKPIETLPKEQINEVWNPYEVTTEDKVHASTAPPAQISLTDCLACSGCVTSAEAVLVSLQSHSEVLNTLDAYPSLVPPWVDGGQANGGNGATSDGKIFVASVSPQSRASIAAMFNISEREAGNMIAQLLSGTNGLSSGGRHKSSFTWVIDTNVAREAALVAAAEEVISALERPQAAAEGEEGSISTIPIKPILTSACPGWICYAEKTHPYVLPHISRLKSPQALTGTLIKSVLNRKYNIPPSQIWHLAIMPCFDKKLEASRSELTSSSWLPDRASTDLDADVRDVDCVITARELLLLASSRGIPFSSLPRTPPRQTTPFPDSPLNAFLFPKGRAHRPAQQTPPAGTSGGYLHHILHTYRAAHPGSEISISRGRNADVVEYTLSYPATGKVVVKMARYYGFRNIQNLVRRLKPAKKSRMPGARPGAVRRPNGAMKESGEKRGGGEYAYVEVMACPGGCTNGGGQIKAGDVVEGESGAEGMGTMRRTPGEQRSWLGRVNEAYFSAGEASSSSLSSDEEEDEPDQMASGVDTEMVDESDVVNGVSKSYVKGILRHWERVTGVEAKNLLFTSFRKVESLVGKEGTSDVERVAGLASSIGGGW